MRRIESIEDANIAHNSLARDADLKRTKDWDFKKLKIRNASPAEDDSDYVVLSQINPVIFFKIKTPALGLNVTNRVTILKDVRIQQWHITANVAPTGTSTIFDIRKIPINKVVTDGVSIFPAGNANKLILPVGAIRAKGSKFHHIPFDALYEEELVIDVLQVGATPGTDICISLTCQRI